MRAHINQGSDYELVIIGTRSNLTKSLQLKSKALVISSEEMLNVSNAVTVPKHLPLIINAFQPATQLSDLTDPVAYVDRSLSVLAQSLAWANSNSCSKIIYTSSAVVYGENPDCNEDDLTQIRGLHGALKVAAEQLTSNFAIHYGVNYTIVRLFNLYGGQDHFSVIHRLVQAIKSKSPFQLINSGVARRDFTHVLDATNAYLNLLNLDGPRILNVGSGRGISVSDLVLFIRELGVDLEIENATRPEVTACVANTERLEKIVSVSGFQSPFTFLAEQIQP